MNIDTVLHTHQKGLKLLISHTPSPPAHQDYEVEGRTPAATTILACGTDERLLAAAIILTTDR